MTLGVFLPAVLILTGIIELVMIGRLRGKLPTRMDPDYEGEETERRRRALGIVMIATAAAPAIAYAILGFIMPEAGAIEVF